MTKFKVSAMINGRKESFELRVGDGVDFSQGLPDIKPMIEGYAQGKYGSDAVVGTCSWGLK